MKSKLKFFIILSLLFAFLPSFGKKAENTDTISIRRAFLDLPSETLDILSKNARFYMLAYLDNDSLVNVENNFQGLSHIEKATPDYLKVSLTPASSIQLKILKLKSGAEIVMSIYTTGEEGDAADSAISFFDSSLRPLQSSTFFPAPKIEDFVNTKGFDTGIKEIKEMLPFYSFRFEANPENDNITGHLSYNDILPIEDSKIIQLVAKPNVTYVWDGKQFKIKK